MDVKAAVILAKMLAHQAAGRKIILCSEAPPPGERELSPGTVIDHPWGFQIRIVRRATRQEFLDSAPDEDRHHAVSQIAPYYYEVVPVEPKESIQ